MTRPTDLPDWATDANYLLDGGEDEGIATKLTPSLGRRRAGHRKGEGLRAQYDNWWKNLAYTWLVWLDAVTSGAQSGITTKDADLGGTTTVNGATLLCNHGTISGNGSSDIDWSGSVNINPGGSLQCDAAAEFTDTCDFTDVATFHNTANFNASVGFTAGTVTIGAAVALIGNTTNTGVITNSLTGRVRKQKAVAVNGNTTYRWGGGGGTTVLGDFIHFTGTLGGNITWLLSEVGVGDGDTVDIGTTDATFAGHTITIASLSGGSTTGVLDGTLGARAVRMYYDGGTGRWRRLFYLE